MALLSKLRGRAESVEKIDRYVSNRRKREKHVIAVVFLNRTRFKFVTDNSQST